MSEGHLASDIRELLKLALPLAAAQAGTQLMGLVDTAVVGRLGAVDIAAVGLGNALFFGIAVFGMGLMMGIDPLISQAVGAGELARARRFFWQGMWLSVIAGGCLTLVILASPAALHWIGVEAAVAEKARTYLLIRSVGVIPMLAFFVPRGYLQAFGYTRAMVVAMIAGNVFNLLADIVLVFGGSALPVWTGPLRMIPQLGVAGAAIATVAGSFLQLGIIVHAALQVPHPNGRRGQRPDRRDLAAAFAVGAPIGLHLGAEAGVFSLVGLLAGKLGSTEVAAHQVVLMIAALTFTVAVGVGSAGSVLVGRAVGAQDQRQTRAAGLLAIAGGGLVMSLFAAMLAIFPQPVARIVTDQPEVIAICVPLLGVAAVFQISDGMQACGAGVLRGAGDTKFPFVVNLIGHWVIGLPIALLLGFRYGLGVVGLWWGLAIGLTVVALSLLARFLRLSSKPIQPL